LLAPEALLDYLRSCVAFEEDERGNIANTFIPLKTSMPIGHMNFFVSFVALW